MRSVLIHKLITAIIVAASISPGYPLRAQSPPPQSSTPVIERPEEARFREGLRSRGLERWLDYELRETKPVDDVDAALRQRESLLIEAAAPDRSARGRDALIDNTSEILRTLLNVHPDHPARLHWRLDLVEDLLYRHDPSLFRTLVLFDLPGRDRHRAEALAGRARRELEDFTQAAAPLWTRIERMSEVELDALHESPSMPELEQLEARHRDLEVWTRLYQAFATADPKAQLDLAAKLLDDLNGRYGYLQPVKDQPLRQIAGLTVAAAAARLAGKPDRAVDYARRAVTAMASPDAPPLRERDLAMALLAVLEQIRALRDAGHIDDATSALTQVRAWVEAELPDDTEPLLAVVLLEHDILIARRSANRALSTGPLPADGRRVLMDPLDPLMNLCRRQSRLADALYTALAPALADMPLPRTSELDALILTLGAALHDTGPQSTAEPELAEARLASAAAAARAYLQAGGSTLLPVTPQITWGINELRYLLAGAEARARKRIEAIDLYAAIPAVAPPHPRAEDAIRDAVRVARELIGKDPAHAGRSALMAYVRAQKLLLLPAAEGFPPESREVGYVIALALEHAGALEEAAANYAAIPPTHPDGIKAMVGALRCQRGLLREMLTSGIAGEGKIREQADRAITAATAAVKSLSQRPTGKSTSVRPENPADPDRRCALAEATLVLANLLNLPSVERHEEALKALTDFEIRFAECPVLIGPALRERILALREVHRLGEARQVVDQFLERNPPDAGPVMIALLEAMRAEIERSDERDDQATATLTATEAAKLAATLLRWSGEEADRMSADNLLTLRVLHAWALLRAGEPAEALPLFQEAVPATAELPESSPLPLEVELGLAECLLATHRAPEALPHFMNLWQRLPEDTGYWWRAYAGSLAAHTAVGSSAAEILASIRQQRGITPELGGPRWSWALAAIEAENRRRLDTTPAP